MLESILRRDRNIVLVTIILLTALAWADLIRLNAAMSAGGLMASMPSMPGMSMGPPPQPFAPANLALTFAMWAVMMVGMMAPSAAPMILLYARVGRQARAAGAPFAATGWFTGGYLASWCAFAVLAGIAQASLQQAELITPMLAANNKFLLAALLFAAGAYQWLPLKDLCLAQCQAPLAFLQRAGGFRRDVKGSFTLGLKHGAFCVGCCWALMALLFVGGVMNLLWIAALAIFVLLEKLLVWGRKITRAAGLVCIAAGFIFLIQ